MFFFSNFKTYFYIYSKSSTELNTTTASNSNRLSALFDNISKQDRISSSLNNNQPTGGTLSSSKSSPNDSSKSSSKKKDKFNTLNLGGLNIKKSSIQRTLTKLKQLEQHHKEQHNQQHQRVRANSANSSSTPSKEQITNLNSKLSKKQSFDSKTLSGLTISSPKQDIKFASTLHSPITNTKVNDLRDLQEIKKALLNKKLPSGRTQTKSLLIKNRPSNSQNENHNKHIVTTENIQNNNSTTNATNNNDDESKNQINRIESPQKRQVTLYRDDNLGFGFIAGSEKPLVIRFVTPG
jgi:hypothetical protein